MALKKAVMVFLPLLSILFIMSISHTASAFTLNINSGNVYYQGYYWSYTSAYESSSSSTTWSAEVDTGNSAYSPINAYLIYRVRIVIRYECQSHALWVRIIYVKAHHRTAHAPIAIGCVV